MSSPFGWSYLIVDARDDKDPHGGHARRRFASEEEGVFESEREMLRELGATGWELVSVTQVGALPRFYFKRRRA